MSDDGFRWYDKDGRPVTEVDSTDGKKKVRPSIIHARKYRLFPSVTSILGLLDKPALRVWQEEQIVLATMNSPPPGTMEDEPGYIRRIRNKANEFRDDAQQAGSDIHDTIEKWLKSGKLPDDEWSRKMIMNLKNESPTRLGGESEFRFCNTDIGYAGTIDYFNEDWILDFKSKVWKNKPPTVFKEHLLQLAPYQRYIEPDSFGKRRAGNVFIHRETAEVVFVEHKPEDMQLRLDAFIALLNFWCINEKHFPGGNS